MSDQGCEYVHVKDDAAGAQACEDVGPVIHTELDLLHHWQSVFIYRTIVLIRGVLPPSKRIDRLSRLVTESENDQCGDHCGKD